MNFIHIQIKFRSIFYCGFLALSLFSGSSAVSQVGTGLPHIQVIAPDFLCGYSGLHSFARDTNGLVYVCGDNKIFQYNGLTWQTFIPGGRCMLARGPSREIYYAAGDTCGKLITDHSGNVSFAPLFSIPSHGQEKPEDIVFLHVTENRIIFSDHHTIYCREGDTTYRAAALHPGTSLVISGGRVFMNAPSGKVFQVSCKGFVECQDLHLPDHTIQKVLPFDHTGIMVKSSSGKFFLLPKDSSPVPVNPAGIPSFLPDYTCGCRLSENLYALGTLSGGLLLTDAKGGFVRKITENEGLYSNRITGLFPDSSGNLWALHGPTVSRLELPSAFSFFDQRMHLSGLVRSVAIYAGDLYAGTSNGLFVLKSFSVARKGIRTGSMDGKFHRVPGIPDNCVFVVSTPQALLASTKQGLFRVRRSGTKHISDQVFSTCFHSMHHPGILFLGNEKGVYAFFTEGSLSEKENPLILHMTDHPVKSLSTSKSNKLWVLTADTPKLIRLSFAGDLNGPVNADRYGLQAIAGGNHHQMSLFSTSNRTFLSSGAKFYRFDSENNAFEQDTLIHFIPPDSGPVRLLARAGPDDNLWIWIIHPESGKKALYLLRCPDNGRYETEEINYQRLDRYNIACICPGPGEKVWLGGQQGIIRYNHRGRHIRVPRFRTIITRAYILKEPGLSGQDNLVMLHPGPGATTELDHVRNSIGFEFISTAFNRETPAFQYMLEGFDPGWSMPAVDHFVEYTGLQPGKYLFKVRSSDVYGNRSESASFSFTISAPFYSSWWAIVIYCIAGFLIAFLIFKWRSFRLLQEKYQLEEMVNQRTAELLREKEKTDKLLANILPKGTADELKLKGRASSKKFELVTVLFADIQGFTKIAEQMNPDNLIDQLDRFYFHFDSVVGKYNIEKIKTIGDAYMAAGGIPRKNRTNPVEVVLAALEMQNYMKELKSKNADIWDLRIGIHTGKVIAGVIGHKKLSYDIWGDTVNVASRMESSGEPGKVNISENTYELVHEFFVCKHRGKMPVKYKGDIDMYFVEGIRPELATDLKELPNKDFFIRLQLVHLEDLEEFILDKLEKELPENLYFHNAEHSRHVYTMAELLGRAEGINGEDMLVLRTAALLHDIGYIDHYRDHEKRSAEMAREILPSYGYSEEQIEQVCKIIMATRMPPQPESLLEKIICDANMDHLGRIDLPEVSERLFREMKEHDLIGSKKEWIRFQTGFLREYDFFTGTAKKLREVTREEQIKKIQSS